MRKTVWAGIAGLLAVAAAREVRAESPPTGAVPLPVDRTGIVRAAGHAYYVDGAQVIPRGVEVTVQLDVTIVGINGASLDVQGGLKVHGTEGSWVTIRNVDFSPTRTSLRGIHLDMADLYGCKFVHKETEGFQGDLTIENSCLQRDCAFDVQMRGGFLKIMTVEFGIPCRIACVRQKENSVPVEVEVRSSWMKEIALSGAGAVNLMHSEIRNGLDLTSVTEVLVDGCDVSGHLAFHQTEMDSYKKVELTKVNFFDGCRLVLERPSSAEAKEERVKIDKPYFGPKAGPGIEDEKVIAGLVQDSTDDPKTAVRAWITKPNKRKHELVAYEHLRSRAPDLH